MAAPPGKQVGATRSPLPYPALNHYCLYCEKQYTPMPFLGRKGDWKRVGSMKSDPTAFYYYRLKGGDLEYSLVRTVTLCMECMKERHSVYIKN